MITLFMMHTPKRNRKERDESLCHSMDILIPISPPNIHQQSSHPVPVTSTLVITKKTSYTTHTARRRRTDPRLTVIHQYWRNPVPETSIHIIPTQIPCQCIMRKDEKQTSEILHNYQIIHTSLSCPASRECRSSEECFSCQDIWACHVSSFREVKLDFIIIIMIVSPKVTHCLLSLWKCPHCRSIVSPKVNPCWLTVYYKSVPSSIKQQRSTCRKCRIWEQQKEDNSIQMKQSDFQLYMF